MTVPGEALMAGPDLSFAVTGAAPIEHAAVPTLGFTLGVRTSNGIPVQAISLNVQVRISPASRGYDPVSQARLVELFGDPARWATSLHAFPWTNSTLHVGPFSDGIELTLPVPCTSDFEVKVAKYLDGVQDGEIPLGFLFSGNVFYRGDGGMLQTCRLSWDKEAEYRFPIRIWRDMMEHYFPDTAWLRLGREEFDRLYAFRTSRALLGWDATIAALLGAAEGNG